MRFWPVVFLVLLRGSLATAEPQLRTDANLITAIDVSGSVFAAEETLQFEGMAGALRDPDVIDALTRGPNGQIGFAVFTWSSGGYFHEAIPWTLIDSEVAARAVADRLAQTPEVGLGYRPWVPGLATDVSSSIEHALASLVAAPFDTPREVVNIYSNGQDNIGVGPGAARAAASERGIVLNAVLLREDETLETYFLNQVLTGPGSFVLTVSTFEDVTLAMRAKFLLDVAAYQPRHDQRQVAGFGFSAR